MPAWPRSRPTHWWHFPRRRRRVLVGITAFLLFTAAVLFGAWTRVCAGGACPSIATLTTYDPDQASKLYAADGRLITDYGLQRRTVVPLKQMSPAVVTAFLAVEDRRFYEHHGIDWIRVFGSIKAMLLGHGTQGFSTITMQLARNLWPDQIDPKARSGLKGLTRKIRESRMALEIERNYPKDKILELYLNQIDLGNRAFGVEAASQRYFGKSARNLNVAEAAMLAALPKAPPLYNPRRSPRLAVQRRNLIIGLMEDWGKLSHQSAEAWKAYPLALSSRSDYSGVAEYFVEYVRQILQARFGANLYKAGFRIFTTLDLDMQQSAEVALESQLEAIEDGSLGPYRHLTYRQYLDRRTETSADSDNGPFSPYLQGLMLTIEAQSGYIRAMVGGRDFEDNKYNRVTQGLRQAGSAFKPFVYAAAIQAGIPLSQIFDDSPVSVEIPDQPTWEPKNYDSKFDGPMTMREALYHSRNTVAVKVGLKLGEDAVVSEAANFGIATRIPRVPSIFIGSADVVPLELIAAYSAFATMGELSTPQAILRVEDRQGHIVWRPDTTTRQVMDPQHAWLILDALRDVVRQPTGTAHSAVMGRGFMLPAGGKTGTTNDGMDVWFVGFTPELVTGVWMGFDKKMVIKNDAQGGKLAAPAWTAMMRDVYDRRRAPSPWVRPDSILEFDIDKSTGYLATPFCPRDLVIHEYFFPGTEPTERCPVHSPFRGMK